MLDQDPRSRRVVSPGLRWLRFPHRLELSYRRYQCQQAVSAFRINAFYILLLYILLISGIYSMASDPIRGPWLAWYIWVGIIVLIAGCLAQIRALDRYFPVYAGIGSFLAVAVSVAIPGFIGHQPSGQLAQTSVIYALVIVYAMVGLRFPVAMLAGWGGGLLGLLVAETLGQGVDWLVMNRTYTGISLLSMFLCYTTEVRDRMLFFNQRQVITQQRRTQAMAERLHRLSRQDSLTGLANRRLFDEELEREWRRCLRNQEPLALMLVDVDCFKDYNDHYGHLQGDRCLQALAAEFKRYARRGGDLVARFGGEEFVLLYPRTGEQEARVLASRLCAAIRALGLPHHWNQHRDVVTVSVGVATLTPRSPGQPLELLEAADQALYSAKQRGRDCWSFFQPKQPVRLVRDETGPPDKDSGLGKSSSD
ncbi:diguanylate cyclase [Alcanivorax hongdengensis A-11-3]|uniref:diguanylate cyclase n=1 Tax=Alcanivorax hongdengensis A-11-3 TaxID=1177179 RepID=L0WGS8_9GAMM|nr:GGDEF domain-containing protein [Alcanivorax hongdengensis]EKF75894.1 diguanylate cyclase [Alcanivorax hongdengensis A-11-3]